MLVVAAAWALRGALAIALYRERIWWVLEAGSLSVRFGAVVKMLVSSFAVVGLADFLRMRLDATLSRGMVRWSVLSDNLRLQLHRECGMVDVSME